MDVRDQEKETAVAGGSVPVVEEEKKEDSSASAAGAVFEVEQPEMPPVESSAGPKDIMMHNGGDSIGGDEDSGGDVEVEVADIAVAATPSAAATAAPMDSSSSEDDSSEDDSSEDDSSSEDDDSDDDDDDDDDGDKESSGLSDYELLRLKRIERNKARLAQLGLGDSIAKRSGHGANRGQRKKERKEEDLVATRAQPKRSVKTGLTQEQLFGPDVRRVKEDKPKQPRRPKKEKYIRGTCFGCKKEEGERIICVYCGYQYHTDCHEPKIELPIPEGKLFRCHRCEGEGKVRRLACGYCDPCSRTHNCGTCVYCIDKLEGDFVKRKKCVMRRCVAMFDIQPKLPITASKPSETETETEVGQEAKESPQTDEGVESLQQQKDGVALEAVESDTAKRLDDSEHEEICFVCRDGGDLICCDDCDRVYHSACHKPLIFNIYAKLHCQECKREEREKEMEQKRQRDKEKKIRKRLASGALAGLIDDNIVFVKIKGPIPCCVVCNMAKNEFKPLPLPPAKRVLYASLKRGTSQMECIVKWPQDSYEIATANHAEAIAEARRKSEKGDVPEGAKVEDGEAKRAEAMAEARRESEKGCVSEGAKLEDSEGKLVAVKKDVPMETEIKDGFLEFDAAVADKSKADKHDHGEPGDPTGRENESTNNGTCILKKKTCEDEPILDAVVVDEDGDDFEVKVAVKWPHENPDAKYGDDMIYCNTCGDWYHLHCVSPPIARRDKGGPRGKWQCKECKMLKIKAKPQKKPKHLHVRMIKKQGDEEADVVVSKAQVSGPPTRKLRCLECDACKREDCGECRFCLDKPKFGGTHRSRKPCVLRVCMNPRIKLVATPTTKAVISSPSSAAQPFGDDNTRVKNDGDYDPGDFIAPDFPSTPQETTRSCINADGTTTITRWSGGKYRSVKKCRVEGCERLSRGKRFDGMCQAHFSEAHPDVAAMGHIYVKLCKVRGCKKNARGKSRCDGMCMNHYNEAKHGVIHEFKDTVERAERWSSKMKGGAEAMSLEERMTAREEALEKSRKKQAKMQQKLANQEEGKALSESLSTETEMRKERSRPEEGSQDDSVDDVNEKMNLKAESKKQTETETRKKRSRPEEVSQDDDVDDKRSRPEKVSQDEDVDDVDEKMNLKPKSKKQKVVQEKAKPEKKGGKKCFPEEKEKTSDLISKQIKKIIRSATNNPDDAKKQDLACEGLRKYARDPESAAKVFQLGGLDTIVRAMKAHPDKALVQAEAIGTLADLVWVDSANNGKQVIDEGCVDLVSAAMERLGTHPIVNKLGCGFFRTLSYDADTAKQVQGSGTAAVVASMKRNPRKMEVLREACAFLQNMTVMSPDLARTILKRKRGESEESAIVPILVQAMENNPKYTELQEAVCGVLSNVALTNEGAFAVAKTGVIPALLPLISSEDNGVELKQSALSVLKHLAVKDDSNKEAITGAGGVNPVVEAMKKHPENVVLIIVACGLLKALAEHDKSNAIEITSHGTVQLIIAAMDKHSEFDHLQAAACGLLAAVKHQDGNKITVAAAKRVLWAMENYDGVSLIQSEGCHALYNLATCTNVLPLLKTRDVRQVLVAAKDEYPDECEAVVDELLGIASLRSSRRGE